MACCVTAKVIRVRLRVEDEVLVSGVLEAVEDRSVVVLGVSFRLLPVTVILDESGNEIGLNAGPESFRLGVTYVQLARDLTATLQSEREASLAFPEGETLHFKPATADASA